jgi:hypothetical protein
VLNTFRRFAPALLLSSGLFAAARDPLTECKCSDSPFLRTCEARVYLGNKEFRSAGFNTYQLFRAYSGLDASVDPGAEGRELMRALGGTGPFLLRVAGPMNAGEFRAVFFDPDLRRQSDKRSAFYSALAAMLDDVAAHGHRVIFTLAWDIRAFAELGGHSLRTLVTDAASPGRMLLDEYVSNVTRRFARDPRIAFWETDNEADLFAGRGQGHFDSRELAGFYSGLISRIRTADPNHLVSTGASSEAVWHVGAKTPNETPEAHAAHTLAEQAAADLVSVHFYYNTSLPIKWYARMSEKAGKPLYAGEIGVAFERDGDRILRAEYQSRDSLKDVKRKLRDARKGASIVLWWNLQHAPGDHFDLHPERTPQAFREIEAANRKAQEGLRRLRCAP